MELENISPDIKKGAKTEENKSSEPDPASHVVQGDPTDMMIPGDDETFGLSLAALLHLLGGDIRLASHHVFGIKLIPLSQPARLLHEIGFINLLNARSKIVGRLGARQGITTPFSWERRKCSLHTERQIKKRSLANDKQRNETC